MKPFSIFLAFLIIIFTIVFSHDITAEKSHLNFELKNDTLIPSLVDFNANMSFDLDDDTFVKLKVENGLLKSLKINGQLIPPSEYKNHKKIFEQIEQEIAQHKKDMAQHQLDMKQHELDMKKHEEDMKQHELDMKQHEEDIKIYEKEMAVYSEDMKLYELDMKRHEEDMKQHELDMKQFEQDMKQHEQDMKQYELDMKQHELEMKLHEEEMKLHNAMMEEIKDLLKKEGYKFNTNEFNIQIGNETTRINGKEVSGELNEKIQKIRNKYIDKNKK